MSQVCRARLAITKAAGEDVSGTDMFLSHWGLLSKANTCMSEWLNVRVRTPRATWSDKSTDAEAAIPESRSAEHEAGILTHLSVT